jgi:hypothetical protein
LKEKRIFDIYATSINLQCLTFGRAKFACYILARLKFAVAGMARKFEGGSAIINGMNTEYTGEMRVLIQAESDENLTKQPKTRKMF